MTITINAAFDSGNIHVLSIAGNTAPLATVDHTENRALFWASAAEALDCADEGKIKPEVVAQAIAKYGIDPNKPNPVTQ